MTISDERLAELIRQYKPDCDAADALRELQKLRDALPKTADGVMIMPGMTLWIWTTEGTLLLDVDADLNCFIGNGDSGRRWTCHAERCYSTRAAAEAARGGG